jgi:hypothetical protein
MLIFVLHPAWCVSPTGAHASYRDYWDLLRGYDYDIYRILPRARTLRILRYDEDLEYFRGVSN